MHTEFNLPALKKYIKDERQSRGERGERRDRESEGQKVSEMQRQ